MGIVSDTQTGIDGVLSATWDSREGFVVPTSETVKLRDGAVNVAATYVYADMADSSGAAQKLRKEVTAKIIRSYLNASTRLLRHYGGEIRSFDGDRVMGIFMGPEQCTKAVRAALAINWAVELVIEPKLAAKWPTLKETWKMGHGVGIDTGKAMIVRGGVRDNNDLVSVGAAPNVAAKLSSLRKYDINITKAVYDAMDRSVTLSGDKNMWTWASAETVGGTTIRVIGSNFRWAP